MFIDVTSQYFDTIRLILVEGYSATEDDPLFGTISIFKNTIGWVNSLVRWGRYRNASSGISGYSAIIIIIYQTAFHIHVNILMTGINIYYCSLYLSSTLIEYKYGIGTISTCYNNSL